MEDINWLAAFKSEEFKKAKGNRLKFVVPMLIFFTALFMMLFAIQSILSNIGTIKIVGDIDLGFFFVMALFPLTGALGIWFARYTKTKVYPYEDQIVDHFSQKGELL